MFVKSFELHLPSSDQLVGDNYDERQYVFVLALEQGSLIEEKVRRLCQSFSNYCYDVRMESVANELNQIHL